MIVVAVLALTIFHPGYCFPRLAGQQRQKASLELESAERKIREREESE
jgi:Tfp pilus assembly protein PilX